MGDLLKNSFATITQATGTAGGVDEVLTGASIGCTVLSVSITNITSTDGEFTMSFKNENSTASKIYYKQSVPANSTFIHNSKICLDAGDTLNIIEPNGDASSFDVVVSYLEQT